MDRPVPPRTPQAWHAWYTYQAGWTRPTRQWLYRHVQLGNARAVLEVGCGTGVVAEEVARLSAAEVVGLDIDAAVLALARQSGRVICLQGDAHGLPFAAGTFDVVLCHYLLLWLADPLLGVREMARVVREGGAVLACAEPDYGGRIDYPWELVDLGRQQAESLRCQGADPAMGRRVGECFAAAGLRTTVGVMAGGWELALEPDEGLAAEWATRRHDLAGRIAPLELDRLEAIDRQALRDGRRVLYVPTFYAWGIKRG